jgi:hypothetical protein
MISSLKTLFKTKTLLYKIWFYLNKKNLSTHIRLPDNRDDFYFEGYPRSGNTYVYGLMKSLYPETKSCSHLHTIAGLKIAQTKGVPAIVIIRQPEDAIASNLFTKTNGKEQDLENKMLTEVIEDWIVFYSYVLKSLNSKNNHKSKQRLHIIFFDKFLSDKYNEMNKISLFLNNDDLNLEIFKDVSENFDETMKLKENNKGIASSSLPSEKRKKFKMDRMEKIKNHPKFQITKNIYNQF